MEKRYTKRIPMNILIVDKNKSFISFISKSLYGYFGEKIDISSCNDGDTAIKKLKNPDIDLLILDMFIPKTNAIQVAKILKYTEETTDIPVIFLTDGDHKKFDRYGFEKGSVDYLPKPVDINILINRINLYKTISEQKKMLLFNNSFLIPNKPESEEELFRYGACNSAAGEMMGFLAHQWRQPLNVISTSIMNLEIKAELELLDFKEIKRISSKVNYTLDYLSRTIDEIRDLSAVNFNRV